MRYRRTAAGIAAAVLTAGLSSCAGASEETTTTAATTPAVTVEVNTETLAPEEAETMDDVADLLKDEELENKTIKWFSFYDPFNATESGNTKSLSLELFERKYGGRIEYIPTTWNQRFTDLSTNILGGTGIDFIPGGDLDSYPKGVPNGQFQAFDRYVDFNDGLWSNVRELNDQFGLNGSHYIMCTQATANEVVFYNRQTIESQGFEDPAELLDKGEWTLSKFREMLTAYVDPEAEQYGLDGWFNEKPIMLSCGVAPVELKDGRLVSNLYDERLEGVMDFMYSLNQTGLVLDKSLFDWTVHPEFIVEGKELFYISGMYAAEGAPEIWTIQFGDPEDVMFVPIPRDENADEYYLTAGLEAFMLCKGAGNPEGTARFMECILASNFDESAQEIADRKRRDDYGWTDDMIEMRHRITEMTAEHPMYSIHTGCPSDMYDLLDSGETGIRAAFYGHDWPSVREGLAPAVDILVDEFNKALDES
ncbi:MAG: extracellular solute-binding protein [Oscillospiraceae bacterium]|nr:extracellular solute-binding protein [Oscillospiraceae bacterium]